MLSSTLYHIITFILRRGRHSVSVILIRTISSRHRVVVDVLFLPSIHPSLLKDQCPTNIVDLLSSILLSSTYCLATLRMTSYTTTTSHNQCQCNATFITTIHHDIDDIMLFLMLSCREIAKMASIRVTLDPFSGERRPPRTCGFR